MYEKSEREILPTKFLMANIAKTRIQTLHIFSAFFVPSFYTIYYIF